MTPGSPQHFRTIMKIALASDHAGFDLKNHLKSFLESKGFAVQEKPLVGLISIWWAAESELVNDTVSPT